MNRPNVGRSSNNLCSNSFAFLIILPAENLLIADAAPHVALQKRAVLVLTEAPGSITEACRQHGISRARIYEQKRHVAENGLERLKDLPPIIKSHRFTTAPGDEARVVALSVLYPLPDGNILSDLLRPSIATWSLTVQRTRNRNGTGQRNDRCR